MPPTPGPQGSLPPQGPAPASGGWGAVGGDPGLAVSPRPSSLSGSQATWARVCWELQVPGPLARLLSSSKSLPNALSGELQQEGLRVYTAQMTITAANPENRKMGQGRRDHGLQAGTEEYANQSSAHLCETLRAKAHREDGTGGPEAGAGVGGSAAKSGITSEGLTDSTSGLLPPRSASPHRQVTQMPTPLGGHHS